MAKTVYVTLKDLAEFNKVDKELLLDFLIDYGYLKDRNTPTERGKYARIQVTKGKYGEFLLFNKNMDLTELQKYRKGGTSQSKKKVGDEYELYIGKVFEEKGFIVKYNGLENGKEDLSIDLIAINKTDILLIQCKNWSVDWVKQNQKFIDHKEIKSFSSDCDRYIEKYPVLKEFRIKKLFIVSGPIFSKSAIALMNDDKIVEYSIVKKNY